MKCPFCGSLDSKVVDSRQTDEGSIIRRRRECPSCKKRWTTYETIEETPLIVVKRDGNRQTFDPEKIRIGIIKSCEKRPVNIEKIDEIVDNVEKSLRNTMKREISSDEIGEIVMEHLKDLDKVAYVRFASVYRNFTDLDSFYKELEKIQKRDDHGSI